MSSNITTTSTAFGHRRLVLRTANDIPSPRPPVCFDLIGLAVFKPVAYFRWPVLAACLATIEQFDAIELEAVLMRARVALSQPAFIEQLIVSMLKYFVTSPQKKIDIS